MIVAAVNVRLQRATATGIATGTVIGIVNEKGAGDTGIVLVAVGAEVLRLINVPVNDQKGIAARAKVRLIRFEPVSTTASTFCRVINQFVTIPLMTLGLIRSLLIRQLIKSSAFEKYKSCFLFYLYASLLAKETVFLAIGLAFESVSTEAFRPKFYTWKMYQQFSEADTFDKFVRAFRPNPPDHRIKKSLAEPVSALCALQV